MNLNFPEIIKAAVPEAEGRNARIESQNSSTNYRDPHFLSDSFPRSPPKLYICAESDDFDPHTVAEWRDEGFDVQYISMESCRDGFFTELRLLSKENRGPCETFGIVAFGDAAAQCLEYYHVLDNNPENKLGLLIAYYPTSIPDPQGKFPSSIRALVHLSAGEEIGVTKQSQMVGIQGKRRTTRSKVQSGLGVGGTLRLAYPCYTYDADPGFAEHDVEEYDRVSAELAWSRSLAMARKAFASFPDLESVVENNVHSKFFTKTPGEAMSTFATHRTPYVTNMPTLTGGIGPDQLKRFYSDFFANPPSLRLTLISRTIGADRVVDEMHVQFKHTQEISWILPGVPATGKKVEVMVVSIVALRAGKLYHEHVYWDQASVLMQVGLLDPKLVPEFGQSLGVKKLPVVGRKAARRVLQGGDEDDDEEDEVIGEADNKLIPGWKVPKGKKMAIRGAEGKKKKKKEAVKENGVTEEKPVVEEEGKTGNQASVEDGEDEERDGDA